MAAPNARNSKPVYRGEGIGDIGEIQPIPVSDYPRRSAWENRRGQVWPLAQSPRTPFVGRVPHKSEMTNQPCGVYEPSPNKR